MNIPSRCRLGLLTLVLAMLVVGTSLRVCAIDSTAVKKLFANPPREFSSAPLWVWNDLLTEEQIVQTLRDLASQRVRQVFVHPRPGLMTPYLGADWFRLWRAALREAERLDMNVWIYDENSYPSGFAGGAVPEAMPAARGQGLGFRVHEGLPQANTNTVAVFRIDGDRTEDVTAQVRAEQALPSSARYATAFVQWADNSPWHGGRSYVNLLHPGVTEKFLDITLGAYRREIGDQFGKRVPGIFTDEPNIRPAGGLPWTDDLLEQFKARWGYDLAPRLASLSLETGDWRRVRHNYFSLLNQLFIERWARPYRDRCDQLGLEMTGHYWEHEWPNCAGVPDNMAMYAWEHRPAIDCLMNQYAENTHAQFGNVRAVRELGSIANQLGKKRTLCEVYGAGGWDLRFEDMKRQADWLGVLGVNTFDQHLSYVTIRGARKRDHPQSFSYHEPWWEAYHLAGAYLERLSVAVSQGDQINSILLLEPTSTAWMYQGNSAQLEKLGKAFFAVLMQLESAQVEYDLGCEDVIARHGALQGKELQIGQRRYHTVVLPPFLENFDRRTWELLAQFTAAGGTVIDSSGTELSSFRLDGNPIADTTELAASARRWRHLDAGGLPAMLRPTASGDVSTILRQSGDQGILFHMRRTLEDGELFLLVNTSLSSPSAGTIKSPARGLERWNLETGKSEPYGFRTNAAGIEADFELTPSGSLVLFASKAPRVSAPKNTEVVSFFSGSGTVEIQRREPNVLVLDYVDITAGGETRTNLYCYQAGQFAFQKNGMERNPWDSAVQYQDELIRRQFPAGSGFQATYRFQIEGRVPPQLSVVIERPDLYSIQCNGLNISTVSNAWWLDKAFGRIDLKSAARVGTNELVLRAAPFTIFHELEPVYVLGDFTLKPAAKGFVIAPNQPIQLGRWNAQGLPFYAAGISYRQQFNLGAGPTGQFVVALTNWTGSVAKVIVNGTPAGYIAYPPWRCDVTPYIWNGDNTIEVVAVGTLKNTLGPHHGKPSLGTAWPGMFQKAPPSGPPPGLEYDTVGYGLNEPFKLLQIRPW